MKYQQEGKRMREARDARGITLEDVGRHVGLSGPAVRHWESGRSKPDVDVARALDALYGTAGEIAALYGYAPEPGAITLADIRADLTQLREGQIAIETVVAEQIAEATDKLTAALARLERQIHAQEIHAQEIHAQADRLARGGRSGRAAAQPR